MYVCADDIKLREVRNLTWDIRSMWEDLGIELDLSQDSLEVGVSLSWIIAIFCHIMHEHSFYTFMYSVYCTS